MNAAKWLNAIPPQHWTRSHFMTACKCDVLVNNLCESFNNYIIDARDKPIISMFEWIRTRLMTRIQQKREGMMRYTGEICPNVLRKINNQQKLARNCFSRWCGRNEFEVDHFLDKYIVGLDKKTCTCGMFQLCGYPCCHAHAAIADRRDKLEDYVDQCYKKEVYLKTYEHMIHGVLGQKDYIKTTFKLLRPPHFKRKRGRPTKLRRKGPNEIQNLRQQGRVLHNRAGNVFD
ncbi:hypothetical protein Sango_2831200 [Sesamum angolense]|uniref:SWIM-type domain-containing protein n=1 Tax=Sesamum angolense TaxID=2727404 RepID=A0AAE1W0M6_9LAMI|nr:hypothetical protein Sango_2831200 [Sesamum angolense]